MGAAKWWSLWAVFNLFFLSWLFDWSKLAKEWAVQRKEDRRQKRVAAVLAAPAVRPRRNASLRPSLHLRPTPPQRLLLRR